MKVLGVHPGPLHHSKIFIRLEPLGLELDDGYVPVNGYMQTEIPTTSA